MIMIIKPIEDTSNFTDVELKPGILKEKETPHCKKHGAMNKVAVFPEGGGYWRCCTSEGIICRCGCIEVPTQIVGF